MFDRKFRNARLWSNSELRKMAHLFKNSVCNVSAWEDKDKEGGIYKNYFINAQSYKITNFDKKEARGSQGNISDEIILDLTKKLPDVLCRKFEVVFNHTTLEHIFDCDTAFKNLCEMSKDVLIVVVPFLQETHGTYGDYWRFTSQSIDKLYEKNNLRTIYISCNDQNRDSIYIFAVGVRKPELWEKIKELPDNKINTIYSEQIGTQIIKNSFIDKLKGYLTS